MDVVGGVMLAGGQQASIVSGIDDHSRFVVSAHVVARATSRPTCDALGGVWLAGETVEVSTGGEVLRVHAIRHDRSREHGAFANAGGRPSRINAA